MIRSLKADLMRLFKSRIFYVLLVFCLLVPPYAIYTAHHGEQGAITGSVFNLALLICLALNSVAIPVFCTSFIGRESSDRGWSRKVSSGLSRTAVYLSKTVALFIVSLIISSVETGMLFLCCNLSKGTFHYSFTKTNIRYLIFFLIWTVAVTLLNDLIHSCFSIKIFSLIVTVMIPLAAVTAGEDMEHRLNEPYRITYVDNDTGEQYREFNPDYLTGNTRKAVTFIYESTPYSYAMGEGRKNFKRQAEGAAATMVLSTLGGILIFRKKEFR